MSTDGPQERRRTRGRPQGRPESQQEPGGGQQAGQEAVAAMTVRFRDTGEEELAGSQAMQARPLVLAFQAARMFGSSGILVA